MQADGVAVVFVELEEGAVDEEVEGVAKHLRGEGEGLVGLLVEEVGTVVVGVEVGGGDELEVGLGKALLSLEGLVEDGSGDEIAHFEANEGLAAACGGGGDVGVETGEGGGLVLEHGFAFDVDCFDEGCHGFQYTDRAAALGGALVSAAAAHELEDGEEDVDGVEVDGEGKDDGGLAVAAGADAGEVAYGEEGEDAEGEPGVGAGGEEAKEDADDADEDEPEEQGEGDAGNFSVVDVEEVGDDAHASHAEAGGDCGLEDDCGADGVEVAVDERADLPAHEIGEEEEEAEGDGGVRLFGEGDGKDEAEDGDEAGKGAPGGRGGDAGGGDEEAEGCDAQDLAEESGGGLGDVDSGLPGAGAGVELAFCGVGHAGAPVCFSLDVLAAALIRGTACVGEYAERMILRGGTFRVCCLLIFQFALAAGLFAQAPVLVVKGLGRGTVAVDGPWQFRMGDDPAWAAPGLDDSGWERVDVSKPWGDQGHWAYAGRAWYRRTIDLSGTREFTGNPGESGEVALYVPRTLCAYEVYWNGRRIGGTDAMPLPTMLDLSMPQVFSIGPPGRGVLAFRASTTPMDTITAGNGTGLATEPRVGGTEAIRNLALVERASQIRSYLLVIVQIAIYVQLILLGAVVWWRNRSQKVIFWMTAFLLGTVLWLVFDPVLIPGILNSQVLTALYGPTFHTLEDIALWYLLLYLLGLQGSSALVRWTRVLAWIAFLSALMDDLVYFWPQRDLHPSAYTYLDALFTPGFSVPELYPLVLIVLALRRGMDPARRFVAVSAFSFNLCFVVAHAAQQGERFTRWTLYDRMTGPVATVWGVEVTLRALLALVLVCAIVYAAYHYMVEQGRLQQAMQQEFHHAAAVQQVLVPDAIPEVPGFAIDGFYKPAGEVGGDFFQILPIREGGVLAVIGDVSGKGMPAAMMVSMLVGTARTLAHYVDSPGAMLAAMNTRMIGRSHGGFTTCLALRIDATGTLTVANAGHLAPYLAGREMTLENGMPLGLVEGASYAETVVRMTPGEQLTILTDGVVEARGHDGALFGFARTEEISVQPAHDIAMAAQNFGQDDDITVLTFTWGRAGEAAERGVMTHVLAPA